MIEYKLSNGIDIQYIKRNGNISSFCIGFNAGALVEKENEFGLAHAVEHMVFKGTQNRTEEEINKLSDEIFGFHNAMTNYPYVIYYGTTLSCDFKKGFEIYSDIILNPIFSKEGFKEEMDVILEELKEWKDEPYQECEDELYYNSFNSRRIKELIIGNEKSIKNIRLGDIKRFYKEHYAPQNCVISVVSSLEFEEVLQIANEYFNAFNNDYTYIHKEKYEDNNEGVFHKIRKDLNGAKIEYCFPIDMLNEEEIKLLKIFNFIFGEGTSSILYDEIRTKNGLVYDISSSIKNESGIKLFTIKLGTSIHNINKAIELINHKIEEIKGIKGIFNKKNISKIIKSLNLKKELSIERSIQLTKQLTTHKIMYNSIDNVFNEFSNLEINEEKILRVINKILKSPSIQVLRPE
ncbi:M16 family metallopeptidase [Clostridium ganghwense]|uniref:Pitrilysin family protein n=1 Tax=Clostridium ganghwense TaxID=312089 RepID=A0ABT4CT83_9CLOT|nr:pitrilysin family protein [Clostridium ganghwense]MCY6372282.1 pitrilysin family protein [Clostridium ganghwense]